MKSKLRGKPQARNGFDSVGRDCGHEEAGCDRGGEAFAGGGVALCHQPHPPRRKPPAGAMENGAGLKHQRIGRVVCRCARDMFGEFLNWIAWQQRSSDQFGVHADCAERVAADAKMSDASACDLIVACNRDFKDFCAGPACAGEHFSLKCETACICIQNCDDVERIGTQAALAIGNADAAGEPDEMVREDAAKRAGKRAAGQLIGS